jgi:hypothetical protein
MITTDRLGGILVGLMVAGIVIIIPFFFIQQAVALPVTGAATLIGPNNATIPVTGITGTEAFVLWGTRPGGEVWSTPNWTPDGAGAANIKIEGAPILGNTKYFVKACDSTGCGNEVSFTTAAITPIVVVTYGAGLRNLTATRFNTVLIGGTLFRAYTNLMPASVMFGLLFGAIVIGSWIRNRSVRLISILMIIISPFIVSSSAGLYLGIPLVEQAIGQALLACGLAGVMLSFIKK